MPEILTLRVEDDRDSLGSLSFSVFMIMLVKPNTAPVGNPFEFESPPVAWYACGCTSCHQLGIFLLSSSPFLPLSPD